MTLKFVVHQVLKDSLRPGRIEAVFSHCLLEFFNLLGVPGIPSCWLITIGVDTHWVKEDGVLCTEPLPIVSRQGRRQRLGGTWKGLVRGIKRGGLGGGSLL